MLVDPTIEDRLDKAYKMHDPALLPGFSERNKGIAQLVMDDLPKDSFVHSMRSAYWLGYIVKNPEFRESSMEYAIVHEVKQADAKKYPVSSQKAISILGISAEPENGFDMESLEMSARFYAARRYGSSAHVAALFAENLDKFCDWKLKEVEAARYHSFLNMILNYANLPAQASQDLRLAFVDVKYIDHDKFAHCVRDSFRQFRNIRDNGIDREIAETRMSQAAIQPMPTPKFVYDAMCSILA